MGYTVYYDGKLNLSRKLTEQEIEEFLNILDLDEGEIYDVVNTTVEFGGSSHNSIQVDELNRAVAWFKEHGIQVSPDSSVEYSGDYDGGMLMDSNGIFQDMDLRKYHLRQASTDDLIAELQQRGVTADQFRETERRNQMAENKKTLKLHARVTKEIEVSYEDVEKIVNYLCGSSENTDISNVTNEFTKGVDSGSYESGYIPVPWLTADLTHGLLTLEGGNELAKYLHENRCVTHDIEL